MHSKYYTHWIYVNLIDYNKFQSKLLNPHGIHIALNGFWTTLKSKHAVITTVYCCVQCTTLKIKDLPLSFYAVTM